MPNPNGTYHCDIRNDAPEDLHYASEGMVVCDRYVAGRIDESAADAQVSPELWMHRHVRAAEDAAFMVGFSTGVGAGKDGELMRRMIALLEKSDDDEIGLLIADLKAGVGK